MNQSATNRIAQFNADIRVVSQYWKHANQSTNSGMGINERTVASADIPSAESRRDSIEVMSFSMKAHAHGKKNSNALSTHFGRRS